MPVNPLVYGAGAILAVIMFTAFAYWTAAWTRSAEAAQLTSMPIIILASLGPIGASIAGGNETLESLIERTPGAAMGELVRIGWFGFDGPDAKTATLDFSDALSAAGQPLLVMLVWTIIACSFASRSMRWEPRS
jgi:ABC-2 type transport system permease protein